VTACDQRNINQITAGVGKLAQHAAINGVEDNMGINWKGCKVPGLLLLDYIMCMQPTCVNTC